MHEKLAYFSAAYGTWIAIAVLVQFPRHLGFVRAQGPERGRPALLGFAPMPRLTVIPFGVIGAVLVAALLAATVSPWARPPALLVAATAALLYFSQIIEVPAVRRKANTVPAILLLLGTALAVRPEQAELAAGWGLFTIKLLVVQMYLSSGLMKLLRPGWRWTDGATLRAKLVSSHLRFGGAVELALASRPGWCRVTALAVLAFELSFWLVIPLPVLAWIYLPLGIAFHVGTAVLMRIHYWIYVVPAYFVFVRY
jgi:hypothetical protein